MGEADDRMKKLIGLVTFLALVMLTSLVSATITIESQGGNTDPSIAIDSNDFPAGLENS